MNYPADDKIANHLYLNQTRCEGLPENGVVDQNIEQIMEWLCAKPGDGSRAPRAAYSEGTGSASRRPRLPRL